MQCSHDMAQIKFKLRQNLARKFCLKPKFEKVTKFNPTFRDKFCNINKIHLKLASNWHGLWDGNTSCGKNKYHNRNQTRTLPWSTIRLGFLRWILACNIPSQNRRLKLEEKKLQCTIATDSFKSSFKFFLSFLNGFATDLQCVWGGI